MADLSTFLEAVQPAGWDPPKGYANGMLAPAGSRPLAVAGQIAWDARQKLVPGGFAAQFEQALSNVAAVVEAAGGGPEHLAQLTIFVTDRHAYLGEIREVGEGYRRVMGRCFPAMALVEVCALLEPGAQVEIQALAFLP